MSIEQRKKNWRDGRGHAPMLGAPGCAPRGAWRRQLVLARPGTLAQQPCSKLGRFEHWASQVEQRQWARRMGAVPSCTVDCRVSANTTTSNE